MVDPNETEEKSKAADTPETASVQEKQDEPTGNPNAGLPDEHSPDPIMTRP